MVHLLPPLLDIILQKIMYVNPVFRVDKRVDLCYILRELITTLSRNRWNQPRPQTRRFQTS